MHRSQGLSRSESCPVCPANGFRGWRGVVPVGPGNLERAVGGTGLVPGPPIPLLFQRRYGGEHRPITGPAVRELIADALAGTGLTDASGRPLRFVPHDFRRILITDAIMQRLAA